ncbi:MAG: polyprenyl synthetase family protein [FCB group bacterium]|nr:polyprenyl synthetase family protein [FCB group bacterium]
MENSRHEKFRDLINSAIAGIYPSGPVSLTEPIHYVLTGGGKRLRPILTLICADACCGDYHRGLPAAIAVEVLHNFTLVHDDIMDDDALRHGQKTVHEKWDLGSAILTGDAMVSLALKLILKCENRTRQLLDSFTEGLLRVCEGQALDKEFETLASVSLNDYIEMIDLKTGHLVGLAAELGAISADAPRDIQVALRDYARLIGRAFQVQDDLLEVYSEASNMGKSLKSDLILEKKTYILIQAMERLPVETHQAITLAKEDYSAGLYLLRNLLNTSGITGNTQDFISMTIRQANELLTKIPIDTTELRYFSDIITNRRK